MPAAFVALGALTLAQTTAAQTTGPADQEVSADATPEEIYRLMFGGEAAKLLKVPYPALIVGSNRGEVVVEPGGTLDETLVDAEPLGVMLRPYLTPEKQIEFDTVLAGKKVISLAELNAFGVEAKFDKAKLALVVDVPLTIRNEIPIALQPRGNLSAQLKSLPPAKLSGHLNLFAGTAYVAKSVSGPTGFERSAFEGRGAVNFRGFVLESGASYLSTEDEPFARSDTRLTYDLQRPAIRLQAGDLEPATAGQQPAIQMAGLAAFRNFDIRPYDIVTPTPAQEFQLQRPARVSVYINGQFQRELRLGPGRYRLTDLPLRSAAGNDVELQIQLDTGETQRLVFVAFYDFDLLKPGISEFALNVGAPTSFDGGRRSYDTQNLVVSGFYRRGVLDNLTFGANFQSNSRIAAVGAELLWATSIGSFGAFTTWNAKGPSTGPNASASSIFYRWSGANPRRMMTLDILARHTGEGFRTLDDPTRPNSFEYDISGRYGVNLTPATRLQISGQVRRLRPDKELSQEYSIGVSQRSRFGSLLLSGYYEKAPSERRDIGIRASWTISFGAATASASYDGRADAMRATYTRSPPPGIGGFGYDVGYSNQIGVEEIAGRARYTANRFEASVEQRIGSSRSSRLGSETSTAANLAAAIVFADGAFGLSRPVYDSFAMIAPNETIKAYSVAADPQGDFGSTDFRFSARSTKLGPAVVPDLTSYLVRSIQVAAPDAPAGVSLGADAISVRPTYMSGYRIIVGGEGNVALIGSLVDEEGQPIPMAAGRAVMSRKEGETSVPFFTNGSGRFYLDGVIAGEQVTVLLESRDARADFLIPRDVIGIARLSDPIRVRPADRAGEPPQQPRYNAAARTEP